MMNELAFYTLPGAPNSPRDLIEEVAHAERLGIGNCFISERFNIKEAATLSGAVGAVSESMQKGGELDTRVRALFKKIDTDSKPRLTPKYLAAEPDGV